MATALQDTDGSASHPYHFCSKKRYCAASAIDIEKHLLQRQAIIFLKARYGCRFVQEIIVPFLFDR